MTLMERADVRPSVMAMYPPTGEAKTLTLRSDTIRRSPRTAGSDMCVKTLFDAIMLSPDNLDIGSSPGVSKDGLGQKIDEIEFGIHIIPNPIE